MNRPVHFEIHSPDPASSIRFYESVLGWKFAKWEGPVEYWLIATGQGMGIDGGLLPSRDGQSRTVNTVQVESLDAAIGAVRARGGQIVVPRMAVRGVGWLAYAVDPTGNVFGMMEDDAAAA